MTDGQVVLRYRSGHTERATLDTIDLDAKLFRVKHEDGVAGDVPFDDIKAVNPGAEDNWIALMAPASRRQSAGRDRRRFSIR